MRRLRLSRRFIMADSGGSRHVDFSYHEQQIVKKILSAETGYSAYEYERSIHLVHFNNSYYQTPMEPSHLIRYLVYDHTASPANTGISTTYAPSITCGSHIAIFPIFQKSKSAAAYRILVCRLTALAGRML